MNLEQRIAIAVSLGKIKNLIFICKQTAQTTKALSLYLCLSAAESEVDGALDELIGRAEQSEPKARYHP